MEASVRLTCAALEGVIPEKLASDLKGQNFKLLMRPPFRLVKAIADAVEESTGFGAGLFDSDELDALDEKKGKLVYLVKLIQSVEFASMLPISSIVSPSNVLSGKQTEATNLFFQALAACGKLSSTKQRDAVERVRKEGAGFWYSSALKKRRLLVRAAAVLKGSVTRLRLKQGKTIDQDSSVKKEPSAPRARPHSETSTSQHSEKSVSSRTGGGDENLLKVSADLLRQGRGAEPLASSKYISVEQRHMLLTAKEIELARREERLQRTAQKLRRDRQRFSRQKSVHRTKFLEDMRKERLQIQDMRNKAEKLMKAAREVSQSSNDAGKISPAERESGRGEKKAGLKQSRQAASSNSTSNSKPKTDLEAAYAVEDMGALINLYKTSFGVAYGIPETQATNIEPAPLHGDKTLPKSGLASSVAKLHAVNLSVSCKSNGSKHHLGVETTGNHLPRLQYDPAGSPKIPGSGDAACHFNFWKLADQPPTLDECIAPAPDSPSRMEMEGVSRSILRNSRSLSLVARKKSRKPEIKQDDQEELEESLYVLEDSLRNRKVNLMTILAAYCSRNKNCRGIHHMDKKDLKLALQHEHSSSLGTNRINAICRNVQMNSNGAVDIAVLQKKMMKCYAARAREAAQAGLSNRSTHGLAKGERISALSNSTDEFGNAALFLDGFDKELASAIDQLAELGVVS